MPEWLDVKKTCFWDVMCFCFVSFFQELGNSALSFFFFKRSLPPTPATALRSGTSRGRGCGLSGTGRARLRTRRPGQTFPGPVFCFYLRTCLCVTTKMPGLFPFLPFFFLRVIYSSVVVSTPTRRAVAPFRQTGSAAGGLTRDSAWPAATCGRRTTWSSRRRAAPGPWWRRTGPCSSARRGPVTSATTPARSFPREGTTPGPPGWK